MSYSEYGSFVTQNNYNRKLEGNDVKVENKVYLKQIQAKFTKLLAKCNLKNMSGLGLVA
jgi:hypothetical protein